MKYSNLLLVCILLFLTRTTLTAQNLVPNGDLETIRGCSGVSSSGYPDILDSAANWIRPTFGSADYLNGCTLSVPTNILGHQSAHSGVGYAGIYIWIDAASTIPDYREYMEVQLTNTLISGKQYHFQMYVSLAESYYSYTTSSLGAYFSDTLIHDFSTQNNLPFTPQVSNSTGPITDTNNWVLIQGDFIAAGGEKYLIIGNFKNYANSDSVFLRSGSMYQSTYIFVDDVSLTTNSTGIENYNDQNERVQLYPNPSNGIFTIDYNLSAQNSALEIRDITGRLVHEEVIRGAKGNKKVDMTALESGMYFYLINSDGRIIIKDKFSINK